MAHTIKDIEICSVGMSWKAATGETQITFENIADAIEAANNDPHICTPRGKLGHYSSLNEGIPMWDPFEQIGDAAPAFGTFVNLRSTNNGATLVADAIDVPDWITAGTYPNRSMESAGNVRTPGGKTYSMVVTGVGWLGTELPAVSDLDDLVTLIESGPAAVTSGKALSISTGTIRTEFHKWCDSSEDTYWWWARDIRVGPTEVIADDDSGGLYRIPFTTDGGSAIEFGEPVKVIEQFIDSPASEEPAAALSARGCLVASFSRPHSELDERKKKKKAVATLASSPEDKEKDMDHDEAQELPEDQGAGPEAIEEDTEDLGTETEDEQVEVEDPIAAAERRRVDRLEKENLALKARLDKRDADDIAARRDSKIAAHVAAGRLSPADRDEYRSLMDLDEERVDNILASRPASVPVGERGEIPDREGGSSLKTGEDGLLPENVSLLTSAERARLARA